MSRSIESAAANASFDSLPAERPFPGIVRHAFTTSRATVSRYSFEPGASFPLHSHPQEQITLIEAGTIEIEVAGERQALVAGDWSVVEPGVEHGITAGANGAQIVAVVSPPRSRSDEYEISEVRK